jgi:hypothetical protein
MSGNQRPFEGWDSSRRSYDLGVKNANTNADNGRNGGGRQSSNPIIRAKAHSEGTYHFDQTLEPISNLEPKMATRSKKSSRSNVPPPPPPPPPPLPSATKSSRSPKGSNNPVRKSSSKLGSTKGSNSSNNKSQSRVGRPPPPPPPPFPAPPQVWNKSAPKQRKSPQQDEKQNSTPSRNKSPQKSPSKSKRDRKKTGSKSRSGSSTPTGSGNSSPNHSREGSYTSTYQMSITDPNCPPGFYCGGECTGTPSYPRYPPGHFETRRNPLGPDFGKNVPKGLGDPCRRCGMEWMGELFIFKEVSPLIFFSHLRISFSNQLTHSFPLHSGRPVFLAELQLGYHGAYHTECFKCCSCGKKLDSTTVSEHQGEIFCKGQCG